MLQGVPDKPLRRIKIYREYDEVPGFEYRLFKIGILYFIFTLLMVFNANKPNIYGFPSGWFVVGVIGCISIFFALLFIFYKLYILKELIGERIEEDK